MSLGAPKMRRLSAIDMARRSSRTHRAPASKAATMASVFMVPLWASRALIAERYRAHVERAERTMATPAHTKVRELPRRRKLGDEPRSTPGARRCRSRETPRSAAGRSHRGDGRVECHGAQPYGSA